MDIETIREKNDSELQTELKELLRQQFKLRLQKSTSQLKQMHKLGETRKAIARLKTVIKERQQKGETA